MNWTVKTEKGFHRLTEVAHPIVLYVDVESGVARIPQHVTPGVVGVIVGAAQFDIGLVVLVALLVTTTTAAMVASKLTGTALGFGKETKPVSRMIFLWAWP